MPSTASSTRCANMVNAPVTRRGYGGTSAAPPTAHQRHPLRGYGPLMRILVIGGSSFVGRHLVQTALDHGHEVTMFNRGQTNPGVFPQAEHLAGDRNSDLSALDGRTWDATVDT